ncbi:unnamed protein product, partial [Prunus brigantina]
FYRQVKIITSSRFQVRYLQNLLGEKTQAPTSNSSKNIITTLSLSFFFSLPIWSSRFLSKLRMPFSRCVNICTCNSIFILEIRRQLLVYHWLICLEVGDKC